MTARAPDLSVVVVNYNSGRYLLACLRSLLGQTGVSTEAIVVDSASTRDQSHALARARDLGARVIGLQDNRGYAGGCNAGIAVARAPWVLLLNADVELLPGCARELLAAAEDRPGLGLAEPRQFLDRGGAFAIPDFRPPRRADLWRTAAAHWSTARRRALSLRQSQHAIDLWRTRTPSRRPALAGSALLARRSALDEVGGFDESYPLYYEDADLFVRLAARGWELWHVPAAQAVHFAHRSVTTDLEAAMRKNRIGRTRYLRRHVGPLSATLDRGNAALASRLGWRLGRARRVPNDAFATADPSAELTWDPSAPRFALELALDPAFTITAGALLDAPRFAFPAPTLDSLPPGRCYLRALALDDDLRIRSVAAQWVLDVPARRAPLDQGADQTA